MKNNMKKTNVIWQLLSSVFTITLCNVIKKLVVYNSLSLCISSIVSHMNFPFSLSHFLKKIPFQVELSQEELQRIITEAKEELGYAEIKRTLLQSLPLFYLLTLSKHSSVAS